MREFTEVKIRNLEMVQQIITRMEANSFALKGWTVTLIAGIFTLSAKDSNNIFILITFVPIIVFLLLDSYYLQLQRKYRDLYNLILVTPNENISFELTLICNGSKETSFLKCMLSATEFGFYFPLALLVTIVIFCLRYL